MKLYFVRHGRTEWNEEGRFQGAGGDSPLTEQAIIDLHHLGKALASIPFDAIYSSDLNRAVSSAQILADENKKDVTVESVKEIREWNLGSLEGQKIDLIASIYPKQIEAFRHNLANFHSQMFGGESLYAMTHRVVAFIQSLKDKGYENVLIVGHGANLVASIRTLLGYEPAQLRLAGGLKNGSVTILETEDFQHFDLVSWNDTSYLEEE